MIRFCKQVFNKKVKFVLSTVNIISKTFFKILLYYKDFKLNIKQL